jgi:alkanesulfonate monooxygenase SsuD/methylene tetrahydromethanopterin reductase-like flavin-dependent oxidoreductase (luciferase family)
VDLCLMIEGQEGVSWSQWVALARSCEEHSVPALFRSDHYMNLDGQHPERESLDAWGTLCALAAITETLRLGTLVSPATFRHPSNLAKLVATADEISGGRVALGLGAGWHEREHEAHGFPFPDTGTRIDVLAEQLEVVLGAWSQAPFSFHGEHYRLSDLDARPKPAEKPHLIMGGNAGPRSAALAARFADEYNTVFPTLEDVRRRKQAVAQACAEVGRETIPFSVMTGFVVGGDHREFEQRVRRLGERIGQDAGAFMKDPPAAWITGTIDEAAEQLTALKDAGVSRVMGQHLLHDDLEAVALLGAELGPRLR